MSFLEKLGPQKDYFPPRVVLIGVPSVGKTTFVASLDDPAIIATERGLVGMEHIPQFHPENYTELNSFLDEIISLPAGKAPFKNLSLDTLDAFEAMCYREVVAEARLTDNSINSIEEVGKGFSKGYTRAREMLEVVLQKLDVINQRHMVAIWITSHTAIITRKQPDGVDYNQWSLKGSEKFNGSLIGWADMVLFANFVVFQDGAKRDKKAVGGDRAIFTTKTPQWEAKNRYGLPPELPFDWESLQEAMRQVHRPTLEAEAKSLLASSTFTDGERAKMFKDIPKILPDRLRKMITHIKANQLPS